MASSLQEMIVKNETFWDFKGKVDYVDEWFLMKNPIPLAMIMISYWVYVLKLGPAYMKNKTPMNLSYVLAAYNVAQIGYSCYLCYIGTRMFMNSGIIHSTCLVDRKEFKYELTYGMYAYMVAKLTELLDTVFFVLKKNYRQITFLHVYHHSVMLLITWLTLKFDPSQDTIFLGTLNSYVHVVMYTYYCLSAIPGMSKYLWWKKYITKMQITQFVLIIIHAAASYLLSGCPPSRILMAAILWHGLLFIVLFTNFYVKSYKKNVKDKKLKQ